MALVIVYQITYTVHTRMHICGIYTLHKNNNDMNIYIVFVVFCANLLTPTFLVIQRTSNDDGDYDDDEYGDDWDHGSDDGD